MKFGHVVKFLFPTLLQILYQSLKATIYKLQRINESQSQIFKGNVLLHVGGNNVCDGRSEKANNILENDVRIITSQIVENDGYQVRFLFTFRSRFVFILKAKT